MTLQPAARLALDTALRTATRAGLKIQARPYGDSLHLEFFTRLDKNYGSGGVHVTYRRSTFSGERTAELNWSSYGAHTEMTGVMEFAAALTAASAIVALLQATATRRPDECDALVAELTARFGVEGK